MDTEPIPARTILVTEVRRRRRGRPWLAVGAVAAIALSGSTFALWERAISFPGPTIAAGVMDIALGENKLYDLKGNDKSTLDSVKKLTPLGDPTAASIGKPTDTANRAQFIMVPGDSAAWLVSADVKVQGDNLTADLTISGLPAGSSNGIQWRYEVYLNDNRQTSIEEPISVENPGPFEYAVAKHTVMYKYPRGRDLKTDRFEVLIVGTFDNKAALRTESATFKLSDVRMTLTQTGPTQTSSE